MQTIETIPLFRTATATPAAARQQAESAPTAAVLPTIAVGDLTGYIGLNVDGSTWAALQAECTRRYGELWTMHASHLGGNYHITRLHARPATYAAHNRPDSHAAREVGRGDERRHMA